MEVAERLERLDALVRAFGELDGAPGEAVALLDREAPVRVRSALEQVGPCLLAQLVLAQEREGGLVVAAELLRRLACLPAARLFDPFRRLDVRPPSFGARQARVRDVADENVLEDPLPLAGNRGRQLLAQKLAPPQRLERGVEVVDVDEAGQGPVPEDAADDRRALRDPPLVGRQQIEPGEDHRLDGVRDLDLVDAGARAPAALLPHEQPFADQVADDLLEEERVAGGALEDQPPHPREEARRRPGGTRRGARSRRRSAGRAATS